MKPPFDIAEIAHLTDAERHTLRQDWKEGTGRWLFWDTINAGMCGQDTIMGRGKTTAMHQDWVMDYINIHYRGPEYTLQQIEYVYVDDAPLLIISARIWVWIDNSIREQS